MYKGPGRGEQEAGSMKHGTGSRIDLVDNDVHRLNSQLATPFSFVFSEFWTPGGCPIEQARDPPSAVPESGARK